jgi:hypothetical protein
MSAASHHVDIEVINFWSFLAYESGDPAAPTTTTDGASHPNSRIEPSSVVVLPDVALTTCDAFLVVLDLSRYDTYTYCHQVLDKLHTVFCGAAAGGAAESDATTIPSGRLVAAVLASTHRLPEHDRRGTVEAGDGRGAATRCVSSDECRALGTRWGVPVFEVSLSPSDMLRHRKVLEKIISRVMHLRGAL